MNPSDNTKSKWVEIEARASRARRKWLIHEDDIIAYCYPQLMEWVARGRPPAVTYFTAGLPRFIATFVEEQLAAQANEDHSQ